MRLLTYRQCEDIIFESYQRRLPQKGDDASTRDLNPMNAFYQRASIRKASEKLVAVTGSKGKGSTAILLASLLHSCGENVGLITSPNFISHRERIRLNGATISENDFRRITTELAIHHRAIVNRLKPTQYLSPNGVFIAIGMRYFAQKNVDTIILEAGRGGRYDDASLLPNDLAIITRIDHEHTNELGQTLERIAWHKAGIIQPSSRLITGEIAEKPLKVITKYHAETSQLPHYHLTRDTTYTHEMTPSGLSVEVKLPTKECIVCCQLATYGSYQAHNLALALTAVHILRQYDDIEQACKILPRVQFFGRSQKILNNPITFVDGAINALSSHLFCESIRPHTPPPRTLVTALPANKDYKGVLGVLAPHVHRIILTEPGKGYLPYDDDALGYARKTHPDAQKISYVEQAIEQGMNCARHDGGSVWIVGTQSLVRSALKAFSGDLTQIISPNDNM